jgi:hypothetical protein
MAVRFGLSFGDFVDSVEQIGFELTFFRFELPAHVFVRCVHAHCSLPGRFPENFQGEEVPVRS